MHLLQEKSSELTIKNRLGLHIRAAAQLAKAAEGYQATIQLMKKGSSADARSILSLVSLGCDYDSKVVIAAQGVDAPEAIATLSDIIINCFGEE